MRPVVYGTVALLIVIAALNLLTTLGLAIRERERDYAVLASVGATPRQVRSVVIAGGAALALPAAVLGLPLGAWIFMLVIGATDPADGPDVRTLPAWWWYPLAIVAAIALTAAISALASRGRHAHPPGAGAARRVPGGTFGRVSPLEMLARGGGRRGGGGRQRDRRLGLAGHVPDPARGRLLARGRERLEHGRARVRRRQRRLGLPPRAARAAPAGADARARLGGRRAGGRHPAARSCRAACSTPSSRS